MRSRTSLWVEQTKPLPASYCASPRTDIGWHATPAGLRPEPQPDAIEQPPVHLSDRSGHRQRQTSYANISFLPLVEYNKWVSFKRCTAYLGERR